MRKTRAWTVKVKPLPEEGRPDDFTGVVGSYRLRVTADRSEAAVNEAIVLRATVEGEGSLHGIPPPALDAPADLKVFEPKSDESSTVRDGKVYSKKTWEWVLVPLAPGELTAPRVRFPYFDFHAGKYAVAEEAGPTIVAYVLLALLGWWATLRWPADPLAGRLPTPVIRWPDPLGGERGSGW